MNVTRRMAGICRPRWLILGTAVFLAIHRLPCEGQQAWVSSNKALLVGIEKYTKASPLQFVGNDLEQLATALDDRGGFDVSTVVDSARGSVGATPGASERDALQQRIESWLQGIRAKETALLYFSGHGFRDTNGKLYLAAIDCDPRDPIPGGIPVQWLRKKLENCPAKSKLLILDACHAGSAKGDEPVPLAKAINVEFRQMAGVTTLASCMGSEKSYLWSDKKQSLFTYFVAQGLRGHADANPQDDVVTVNELDTYVNDNVAKIAQSVLSATQTPTRIQGPNVTQHDVVNLKPGNLKGSLDDMAEQMDLLMRREKLPAVGVVPQFAYDKGQGLALGIDYGTLPSYLATELANRLGDKKQAEYRVVNPNAMGEILGERDVKPSEVGTSKTKGIAVEAAAEQVKLPAIISGTVVGRHKDKFQIKCQLLGTDWYDTIGSAGATAALNEQELAMMGVSFRVREDDRREQAPTVGSYVSVSAQLIGNVEPRLQQPEDVLASPRFPCGVEIRVKQGGRWQDRPLTFRDGRYDVELNTGDIYGIWLNNRSNQEVFARLLVDGLNTLPEKSQYKGVFVESAEQASHMVQAPPVSLAEARAWALYPKGEFPIKNADGETEIRSYAGVYSIRGFYASEGDRDPYNEFVVVDASQSVATQRGYTKHLGLITAAFYEAADKRSRGGGSGYGRRYDDQLQRYQGKNTPGNLLGVIHIRYGEQ